MWDTESYHILYEEVQISATMEEAKEAATAGQIEDG
jgi:hypothetical protein